MSLSWLLIFPFVEILALSFFLSFHSLKKNVMSLLFPSFIILLISIIDRVSLRGQLLEGIGSAINPLIRDMWAFTAKDERSQNLASGTILLVLIFFLFYFTSWIMVTRLVTLSDPSTNNTLKKRVVKVLMSLSFLSLTSYSLLYFVSGFRAILYIEEGLLSPLFNWFVPIGA